MIAEQPNTSLAEDVLGITDRSDMDAAFAQAAQTLGYAELRPSFMRTLSPDSPDPVESETFTDTHVVAEVFTRDVESASTLTEWMSYLYLMHAYGNHADGNASALMIGSIGAISSRSFVCLAQNVYGADKAHIIDLVETEVKSRHGIFQRGSGLDLPYDSESMDFVHTNRLLHMLEDPSSPNAPYDYKFRLLMQEINRVLKPGGQLLMCERVLKDPDQLSAKEAGEQSALLGGAIVAALRRFNMVKIYGDQVLMPRDDSFLFVPQRSLLDFPCDLALSAICIYALKQPHSTFYLPSSPEVART